MAYGDDIRLGTEKIDNHLTIQTIARYNISGVQKKYIMQMHDRLPTARIPEHS